jgi:hypothetical protein
MPLFKPSHPIIRPLTVTVLATIWGILGLLLSAVGLLCILGSVWIYHSEPGILTKAFPKADFADLLFIGLIAIPLGIISTLTSIPAISACLGLMRMKHHGLLSSNSASGIFFLFNLITFPFMLNSVAVIFNIAFAGLSIFTWVYLNRKCIRRQFL